MAESINPTEHVTFSTLLCFPLIFSPKRVKLEGASVPAAAPLERFPKKVSTSFTDTIRHIHVVPLVRFSTRKKKDNK